MRFIFLILSLLALSSTVMPLVQLRSATLHRTACNAMMKPAQYELTKLVAKAEIIFIVPIVNLIGSDSLSLNEAFDTKTVNKEKLVEAIDGTPFVQILPDLSDGQSFLVTARGDSVTSMYERFVQWYKKLDKRVANILIAYKDRYIILDP